MPGEPLQAVGPAIARSCYLTILRSCLAIVRSCHLAIVPLLISACTGLPHSTHPDTSDWQPLFEPDLSNALNPGGVWTIEDGVLTASADSVLWTERPYDDFVLDLEFRNDAGTNSGVIVHASDLDDWIPNSVEIQIADDYAPQWAEAPASWRTGAAFGHQPAEQGVVHPAGEWNRMTVTVRDHQIDVVLNGQHVNSLDMRAFTSATTNPDGTEIPEWLSRPLAEIPREGHIGLQGKHAGAPIWFRNMRVQELTEGQDGTMAR